MSTCWLICAIWGFWAWVIRNLLVSDGVFGVHWQETAVGDESCPTPVGNVRAHTHHFWRDSHCMPCFLQVVCVSVCACVCAWERHELTGSKIPHVCSTCWGHVLWSTTGTWVLWSHLIHKPFNKKPERVHNIIHSGLSECVCIFVCEDWLWRKSRNTLDCIITESLLRVIAPGMA